MVLSRPEGLQACSGEKQAQLLRARFNRIFKRASTGYATLDRLLRRLFRKLLRVLERPEIPINTNSSENDIRAFVMKRKISGGTVSDKGRDARDIMLGLAKTCMKLKLSFYEFIGARLGIPGPKIPPLASLIRPAPHKSNVARPGICPVSPSFYGWRDKDLARILAYCGVSVDHVTVSRWTHRCASEIDTRIPPHLQMENGSWRTDETCIKVKGRWIYLYRAADSNDRFISERQALCGRCAALFYVRH